MTEAPSIPEQFKDARFIPLIKDNKKPVKEAEGWAEGKAFINYEQASKHLKKGNVGLTCGYDKLFAVDADLKAGSKQFSELLQALDSLGETLVDKTTTDGFHYFFYMSEPDEIHYFDLVDNEGVHFGEIRAKRPSGTFTFVVGPESSINGKKYQVVKNNPIKTVTKAELMLALKPYIKDKKVYSEPKVSKEENALGLKITDFIDVSSFRKLASGDLQGPHPQGSSTGNNLTVHPEKNTFYDFRFGYGGGPLLLWAILKGFVSREEGDKGLKGKKFLEVAKAFEKETGKKVLKEEAPKKQFIPKSFYEKEGAFYEQAKIESRWVFVNYFEGKIQVRKEIKLTEDCIVIPMVNSALTEGAVILPSGIQEYESEEKLIDEIQAFIRKYLDVSPDFETFSAYYVLLSWVQDRLTTVPYLRALGDFSTGKSRFLDVVGKICYKPIVMAGTVTPAPLYRLQSAWKGTVLIDEGDRKKSDEADEITKILNCGFERNKPILRCDKNNPDDVQVHDAFGCKVLGTRYNFYDSALESRCLTENMKETSRTDIPTILPPAFFEEQEVLRQKLLMFRLKERQNIDANKIQSVELGAVERRLKQALSSFAVLFANKPALFERFKAFVLEYQHQLIEERETSLDGVIVNYLQEKGSQASLTPSDFAKHLKDNASMDVGERTVGRHLKALGIEVKQKKIEGKNKRVVLWNEVLFDRLFQKYNAEYWKKKREPSDTDTNDTNDTDATDETVHETPKAEGSEKVTTVAKVTLVAESLGVCEECGEVKKRKEFEEKLLCADCIALNRQNEPFNNEIKRRLFEDGA